MSQHNFTIHKRSLTLLMNLWDQPSLSCWPSKAQSCSILIKPSNTFSFNFQKRLLCIWHLKNLPHDEGENLPQNSSRKFSLTTAKTKIYIRSWCQRVWFWNSDREHRIWKIQLHAPLDCTPMLLFFCIRNDIDVIDFA